MRVIPTFWFYSARMIEQKLPSEQEKCEIGRSYRSIVGYRSDNQNRKNSCAEYRQIALSRKPLLPAVLHGHEKNWAWQDLLRYKRKQPELAENGKWNNSGTDCEHSTKNWIRRLSGTAAWQALTRLDRSFICITTIGACLMDRKKTSRKESCLLDNSIGIS